MIAVPSPPPGAVDYDIHGLLGIRLLDPSQSDSAAVDRQLGPMRGQLAGDPDITIRFVDRLSTSGEVRCLGQSDAAFTDEAFLLFHGRGKSRRRVAFPFARIGKQCEIVCETGITSVPLLIATINLTMLARDVVPLHASAIEYRGTGVVAAGWSKGGKTETLLALAANGGRYVGDEWVYVSGDGKTMYGLPQPVRVWEWHLEQLPQYRAALGTAARARVQVLKRIVNALEGKLLNRCIVPPAKAGLFGKLSDLLRRQMGADIQPRELFGSDGGSLRFSPDHLLFVGTHEAPGISVAPIDPLQVASRMVHSLQFERLPLVTCYRKFQFAFPDQRNELIESAGELERYILERAFQHTLAHAVYHPYPVPIRALYEAVAPLLDEDRMRRAASSSAPAPFEERALANT